MQVRSGTSHRGHYYGASHRGHLVWEVWGRGYTSRCCVLLQTRTNHLPCLAFIFGSCLACRAAVDLGRSESGSKAFQAPCPAGIHATEMTAICGGSEGQNGKMSKCGNLPQRCCESHGVVIEHSGDAPQHTHGSSQQLWGGKFPHLLILAL